LYYPTSLLIAISNAAIHDTIARTLVYFDPSGSAWGAIALLYRAPYPLLLSSLWSMLGCVPLVALWRCGPPTC
jgi:hypothetical protein